MPCFAVLCCRRPCSRRFSKIPYSLAARAFSDTVTGCCLAKQSLYLRLSGRPAAQHVCPRQSLRLQGVMAQSENSTSFGQKGLRLCNSQPTVSVSQAACHHNMVSSTPCSSHTISMAGPSTRCRKRPPSPEVTTGSLSTLASCGKKTCFSALSDSKQPRTTLLNYYPYSKPAHTALTSAVTETDEDDFDEAVSSFRAPPGHIPHPDDLPQHLLQSNTHQPPYGLSLPAHHQTTMLPFHTSHAPVPCGSYNPPLTASFAPMYSNSSTPVHRAIPFGSRPTSTAYRPAAGILSGSAESARSQQAAAFAQQPSLMNSDQTEAKHASRRHSLPHACSQAFRGVQVRYHNSAFYLHSRHCLCSHSEQVAACAHSEMNSIWLVLCLVRLCKLQNTSTYTPTA